jgi:hypothetical protein
VRHFGQRVHWKKLESISSFWDSCGNCTLLDDTNAPGRTSAPRPALGTRWPAACARSHARPGGILGSLDWSADGWRSLLGISLVGTSSCALGANLASGFVRAIYGRLVVSAGGLLTTEQTDWHGQKLGRGWRWGRRDGPRPATAGPHVLASTRTKTMMTPCSHHSPSHFGHGR